MPVFCRSDRFGYFLAINRLFSFASLEFYLIFSTWILFVSFMPSWSKRRWRKVRVGLEFRRASLVKLGKREGFGWQ